MSAIKPSSCLILSKTSFNALPDSRQMRKKAQGKPFPCELCDNKWANFMEKQPLHFGRQELAGGMQSNNSCCSRFLLCSPQVQHNPGSWAVALALIPSVLTAHGFLGMEEQRDKKDRVEVEAQLHSCHRLPMSPWENQLLSHHLHDHCDIPIPYQLLQKNTPLDSLGKGQWGILELGSFVPDSTAGRNSCSSRTAPLGVVEVTCVFPQEHSAPHPTFAREYLAG